MVAVSEAIETYTYVISGLSEPTQTSYCDKLAVFAEFCAEHGFPSLEDITPKVFKQFIEHVSARKSRQTCKRQEQSEPRAIELSPLLVLIGMLMTGVDIYLAGRLATQIWFEIPWAIVQVLAIDGLWFAVWLRILSHTYERHWLSWARLLGMIVIGLAMVAVAFLMNDIVLFQQVDGLSTSLGAMAILGIPLAIFTHFRAGLLVATATLAMLFSRKRHIPVSQPMAAQKAKASQPRANRVAKVTVVESEPKAIPEVAISHQESNDGLMEVANEQANGLIESSTVSPKYGLIKEAMANSVARGEKVNLRAIANETGAGYSTVKLYAPQIKTELGVE